MVGQLAEIQLELAQVAHPAGNATLAESGIPIFEAFAVGGFAAPIGDSPHVFEGHLPPLGGAA